MNLKDIIASLVSFSIEFNMVRSSGDLQISKLLKRATLESSTSYKAAIVTLRKAMVLIKQSKTEYAAETYTRLHLYLQKDGQYSLLKDKHLTNHPDYRSIFYDKMRLAAEREKRHAEALVYALLSNAYACVRAHKEIDSIHNQLLSPNPNKHKEAHKEMSVQQIKELKAYLISRLQDAAWLEIINRSKAKANNPALLRLCNQFSEKLTEKAATDLRAGLSVELNVSP